MKLVTFKTSDRKSAKIAIDYLFERNIYFDFEPVEVEGEGERFEIRTSPAVAVRLGSIIRKKLNSSSYLSFAVNQTSVDSR
jgi:hypothetical protein